VLAVEHRLRRRDEFAAVIKSGRRAGRGSLVVHVLIADQSSGRDSSSERSSGRTAGRAISDPVRVGFVIPRAAGNAVRRNKVRRRLRHLLRDRLDRIPPGTDLVVRVSAAATGRSYTELGADLDAAVAGARRKAGPRNAATGNPDRGRKARSSA